MGAEPNRPVRTCLGCRERAVQSDMVRVVWDGFEVVVSRRAPGRGAWLHPRAQCWEAAGRKGVLARAFHAQVPAGALPQMP